MTRLKSVGRFKVLVPIRTTNQTCNLLYDNVLTPVAYLRDWFYRHKPPSTVHSAVDVLPPVAIVVEYAVAHPAGQLCHSRFPKRRLSELLCMSRAKSTSNIPSHTRKTSKRAGAKERHMNVHFCETTKPDNMLGRRVATISKGCLSVRRGEMMIHLCVCMYCILVLYRRKG